MSLPEHGATFSYRERPGAPLIEVEGRVRVTETMAITAVPMEVTGQSGVTARLPAGCRFWRDGQRHHGAPYRYFPDPRWRLVREHP